MHSYSGERRAAAKGLVEFDHKWARVVGARAEDDATDGAPTMLEPLSEADAIVSTSFFNNHTLAIPEAPPVQRVIGQAEKAIQGDRRAGTGKEVMVPTAGSIPAPWRYDDHYGFNSLSCIE